MSRYLRRSINLQNAYGNQFASTFLCRPAGSRLSIEAEILDLLESLVELKMFSRNNFDIEVDFSLLSSWVSQGKKGPWRLDVWLHKIVDFLRDLDFVWSLEFHAFLRCIFSRGSLLGRTLPSRAAISHPLATMVDERNPTSSETSKPNSSKTEKQVDSSVPPLDASKSDISNSYFTHHSDHPGLVLISKPLNGDNYSAWRRAMTLALNAKNKLDSVIYYATAYEVWEDLRERFSQSNAPGIFEIQREIAYHRQEQLSISVYYTKLKSLWNELASYNDVSSGAQQDQQRLMQFLMGLKESYNAIRGQILLLNPLPSVLQAYSFVCQEEKQRFLSVTHTTVESNSSAAMAVRSNQMKNNFAGNARSDRSESSTAVHKIHDGLIKTNVVQDLPEGDLSAPIVGKWDTLSRSVISCTDILQGTQR
ncbi:hypothetical protein CK203_040144 [Vitis vinifera]|uniref:Retrotransposon Copia-like N-terminal domain-containing protein n=1 Tax=Vitis vinifera TaxID=29760 RepID=A0A438H3I3_VITVI|nr:hypothetical protein CK203_040144 [Vitis vinifera]